MNLTSEQFKKISRVVTIILIFVVFLSVYLNSALIAVFGIGFGVFLMSFLKSSVKDKMVDERIESISNRAAMLSFKVMLPVLGITSIALLVSSGKEEFYYLHGLGIVLSYITCVALLIYLIAYFYLSRVK